MFWHSPSRVNNYFSGIQTWFRRSSCCLTQTSSPYLQTTTVFTNLAVKPYFKLLCHGSSHPRMAAYLRTDITMFIPAWRMRFGRIYRIKQQYFLCMGHAGTRSWVWFISPDFSQKLSILNCLCGRFRQLMEEKDTARRCPLVGAYLFLLIQKEIHSKWHLKLEMTSTQTKYTHTHTYVYMCVFVRTV